MFAKCPVSPCRRRAVLPTARVAEGNRRLAMQAGVMEVAVAAMQAHAGYPRISELTCALVVMMMRENSELLLAK